MSNLTKSSRVVFYLLLALLLLHSHLELCRYAMDDAYIHFRIARNFVLHALPYYDLDYALAASSSPLWTLFVSFLFCLLGIKIEVIAVANSLICLLLCYVWSSVVKNICQKESFAVEILVCLVCLSVILVPSIGLMETALALLLLGMSYLCYLKNFKRSEFIAVVLASLSALCRLELVVALLVLLFAILRQNKQAWKSSLSAIIFTLTPVCIFSYYYYAALIPHTVKAKSLVYSLSYSDFGQKLLDGIYGWDVSSAQKGLWLLLYIALVLALLITLCFRIKAIGPSKTISSRRNKVLQSLLFTAILIILGYAVQKVHLAPWYYALYTLPLLLYLVLKTVLIRDIVLTTLCIVVLTPYLYTLGNNLSATLFNRYQYSFAASGSRVQQYLETGKELSVRFPKASLMAPEIGGLGYSFRGKLIDSAGLVTPEALSYHPLNVPQQRSSGLLGAVPLEYIVHTKPDLIVSLDIFIEEFLSSEFKHKYILEKHPIYHPEDQEFLSAVNLWHAKHLVVAVSKKFSNIEENGI